MKNLKDQLEHLIKNLSNDQEFELRNKLDNLMSVYPFNEYEFIISTLMGLNKLTLDDYYLIRDEYIARNMYLHIFEISAPRGFGESWAQGHLKELVPDLIKPTKKIDPNYSGQYDFILKTPDNKNITIEVKASRAVDFNSQEPLYIKALSQEDDKPFDMNFQQIKPKCSDVFIWIGVWRDIIKYWVISSKEVENNKFYSKGQHRGNVGEGQLHLKSDNISSFSRYLSKSDELKRNILEAYQRNL